MTLSQVERERNKINGESESIHGCWSIVPCCEKYLVELKFSVDNFQVDLRKCWNNHSEFRNILKDLSEKFCKVLAIY